MSENHLTSIRRLLTSTFIPEAYKTHGQVLSGNFNNVPYISGIAKHSG